MSFWQYVGASLSYAGKGLAYFLIFCGWAVAASSCANCMGCINGAELIHGPRAATKQQTPLPCYQEQNLDVNE